MSEDLNLVSEGPQALYATPDRIVEGNEVLERGSKIALDAGPVKRYDLESVSDQGGFRTVSFDDYHRVIPRYNPRVPGQGEDLPREVSPEKGDSPREIERKHEAYGRQLARLATDFEELLEVVEAGRRDPLYAKTQQGLASLVPLDWFQAVSAWGDREEIRRQVLSLGLSEIKTQYVATQDVFLRAHGLQKLGRSLDGFIGDELGRTDSVALPTDCAQIVGYVVTGGEPVQDDRLAANPEIGSNYYTALPENAANVGWNFHWAGVILKGGPDNATLESAGGLSLGSMGKSTWWMDLYGTRNVDQTFKKRLHRLHVERNREMLEKQEPTKETETSYRQLQEQQKTVEGWTELDSDE